MTATLILVPAVGQAYSLEEPDNRITQIARARSWLIPEFPVAGETARADDIIRMPLGLTIEGDVSADEALAGGMEKLEALGGQILTVQIRTDRLPEGVPDVLPLMAMKQLNDTRSISSGPGAKWTMQLQKVLVSAATTVFVTPVPGRSKVAGASEAGKVPTVIPEAQTSANVPQTDGQRVVAGVKALGRLTGG